VIGIRGDIESYMKTNGTTASTDSSTSSTGNSTSPTAQTQS